MTFLTPIIFTWKGTIPAKRVNNQLVSSMDVLHTILHYTDIERPANLRGNSLIPNINGESDKGRDQVIGQITQLFDEKDTITFMGKPAEGYWLRTPKYHFVWDITHGEELLFDMQMDPKNDNNIADQEPQLVREFRVLIVNWKHDMGIE